MARTGNTVPKRITNSLGVSTTVHVNPDTEVKTSPELSSKLTQVASKSWGSVPELKNSPWGRANHQDHIDDGIARASIDGYSVYSAYKLSKRRNDAIPEEFRQQSGWYEADSQAAILPYTFPESFSEEEVEHSLHTLKNQHWRQYEAMTGEDLSEDESYGKQIELFHEANKNNFVGTGENPRTSSLFPGQILIEAIRSEDGQKGHYLVPKDEYAQAKYGQFVVDPSRHADANVPQEDGMLSPNEFVQRSEIASFSFQWADQLAGLDGFETNDQRNSFSDWVAREAAWDTIDNQLYEPSRERCVRDWSDNHERYMREAEARNKG